MLTLKINNIVKIQGILMLSWRKKAIMGKNKVALIVFAVIIAASLLTIIIFRGDTEEAVVKMLSISKELVIRERGLNFSNDVDYKIVTSSWVRKNWGKISEADRQKYLVTGEIYHLLRIIPWNVDLLKIVEGQRGAAMAAAVGNTVYIVKEYFNAEYEAYTVEILVHELTHVLQRQNLPQYNPEFYDETMAWYSLIEGDALLTAYNVATKYYNYTPFRVSLGYPDNYTEPLRMLWLFPYAYGDDFVMELYDIGGWELVNECYSNPPLTTMQILHPDKYLAGIWYSKVYAPTIPGFRMLYSDRMGEFFVNVFIGVNAGPEYVNVSSGWRGDNLTLQSKDNVSILLWVTLWDEEEHAELFYETVREAYLDFGNLTEKGTIVADGVYYAFLLQDSRVYVLASKDESYVLEAMSEVRLTFSSIHSRYSLSPSAIFKAIISGTS